MKRRPEPELMEGAEQALAYAEADFSEANGLFMALLGRLNQTHPGIQVKSRTNMENENDRKYKKNMGNKKIG
jgi:hypothetical protein